MSGGVRMMLAEVHEGEAQLEKQFHLVAERHPLEHEVHHLAVDLARWSRQNRQDLVPLAARYGKTLAEDEAPRTATGPIAKASEKIAELLAHRAEPGLLLLDDLRQLFLLSSDNSVLWTMLAQAAETMKDSELLEIVSACHSRTMRQVLWCNGMIKELSSQVLTTL